MLGYIRGKLVSATDDGRRVIQTSEPWGVGYSVLVPNSAESAADQPGKVIELHLHTHVREDALELFGFRTAFEKEVFLSLLTVSGIGPRVGLGLLSKVPATDLVALLLAGDKDALTQFPGVGKKTAERLVLELKDSIAKRIESGDWAHLAVSAKNSVKTPRNGIEPKSKAPVSAAIEAIVQFKEAREALVGLGYREQQAVEVLKRVTIPTEGETQQWNTETLIRLALRELRT
jgi:Holliday junction DNA helicase RuvA